MTYSDCHLTVPQSRPRGHQLVAARPGVEAVWGKVAAETKKRIVRLLGMRIAINRVEPGNDRTCDPELVCITKRSA